MKFLCQSSDLIFLLEGGDHQLTLRSIKLIPKRQIIEMDNKSVKAYSSREVAFTIMPALIYKFLKNLQVKDQVLQLEVNGKLLEIKYLISRNKRLRKRKFIISNLLLPSG